MEMQQEQLRKGKEASPALAQAPAGGRALPSRVSAGQCAGSVPTRFSLLAAAVQAESRADLQRQTK